MDLTSISGFQFLIFVIPGFVTVWTFRYFTQSKKKGDFELFGLSFAWGLILLFLYELLIQIIYQESYSQKIKELLKNPYSAALALSLFAILVAWIGSRMSKTRWFKRLIKKLNKN